MRREQLTLGTMAQWAADILGVGFPPSGRRRGVGRRRQVPVQILGSSLAGGAGRKGKGAQPWRILAREWLHRCPVRPGGLEMGSQGCWSTWESLGTGDQDEVSWGRGGAEA